MKKFKAVDLFAGIGGIKLGLQLAGFDVIYSNDNDPYCKLTFETNFPGSKFDNRDISSVSMDEISDHDLLAGGFPCQPFSMAGHKKGFDDPRGSLFFTVAKIIKAKQPKAFLLENVKNLKSHNNGESLKCILDVLRNKLGYYVPDPAVLNSKDFGLPQNRERIYIVGFRDNIPFEFPTPLTNTQSVADILEKRQVEEFYFLSQKYYEGLANHKARHQAKGSGFGFEILDPSGISHALVVGNMGRERNLIQDSPRIGFYPENTNKAIARNNLGVRKLTVRECARLQGFPEWFTFPVSRTQAYKQLGNTVSVPVIKEIAIKILDVLYKQSEGEFIESQYFPPSNVFIA